MIFALALFNVPLVGLDPAEPHIAHRVDMKGLPMDDWETAEHVTTRCGIPVKLTEVRWGDFRTRGTPFKRCATCRKPAADLCDTSTEATP